VDKNSKIFKAVLTGKRAFWHERFYEIIFGLQNPFQISNPEFGDVQFISWFNGDTSTGRGSTKNRDKISKSIASKREL